MLDEHAIDLIAGWERSLATMKSPWREAQKDEIRVARSDAASSPLFSAEYKRLFIAEIDRLLAL